MIDRSVVKNFRRAFKVTTPERVTVIVFFKNTCYLILVVYLFNASFLGLVYVARVKVFFSVV